MSARLSNFCYAIAARFLMWILRLFAWPWTARSLEGWLNTSPARFGTTTPCFDKPQAGGACMDADTANLSRGGITSPRFSEACYCLACCALCAAMGAALITGSFV